MSVLQELKFNFKTGGPLIRLIFLNIGVFMVFSLLGLAGYLFQVSALTEPPNWFAVPANPYSLLTRPWTPLTYMFIHHDLFHILGNMIMLYFGGRIFTEFLGSSRLFPVYLLGGLFGALLFFSAFNALPAFDGVRAGAIALGASASVLAVFFAIASYLPNYEVNLFLFGFVRLKWVALILLVFDLISINRGNPGGHIAHLGGALFGYLYAMQLRRGRDLGAPIAKAMNAIPNLFKKKKEPPHARTFRHMVIEFKNHQPEQATRKTGQSINHAGDAQAKTKQEIIDEILDKISRSGYDSLTREEKETIFRISREE